MPGMGDVTLSAAQAAFIEGPRSVYATGRDAARRPSLARVLGCVVADDRRRVLLIVQSVQARQVLRDVADNGALAIVFNAPETHQTLQMKGRGRCVAPPPDAEALVQQRLAAFTAVIAPHGFAPELVHAIVRGSPDALTAIDFEPQALFEQTPGPQAGRRIADDAR